MKRYIYEKTGYQVRVIYSGVIGGIVMLIGLVELLKDNKSYLWLAAFIVGLYTFWEVFVSGANPSEVDIGDDELRFISFGKAHTFRISELTGFKDKEFLSAKKCYLRLNDPGFFSGRYWVNCRYFNDADELFLYFRELESKVEPETLKQQARRSGEESYQKRVEQQKKKAEEREAAAKAKKAAKLAKEYAKKQTRPKD